MDKKNERFERYYNALLWGGPRTVQDPVEKTTTEDETSAVDTTEAMTSDTRERDLFWDALKRELPNSFRFCGSRGYVLWPIVSLTTNTSSHALAVQKLLKSRYIPEITQISHFDGRTVEPPQHVPWYPDELAWSMTTPKNIVRKFEPFKHFQRFLVSETGVGNISRQEIVSMIPPLVLDLRPGMTVLDMCAAPGSKAAQLLEMVHRGEEGRMKRALARFEGKMELDGADDGVDASEEDNDDDGRATGLLIANDSDYKRSHMLIHQLKRLSSPNLIVTNHDATIYPSIKLPPSKQNPAINRYLKFDRILADVPCSGDGTTRKNVNLWKDWNPGNAMGLHPTQVRILVRAIQMLKAGGRIVYSTCSMNPIENEAVVATAIRSCGGVNNVQLVESEHLLPELKRNPGLTSWNIMDKTGRVWDNYGDVEAEISANGSTPALEKMDAGMFPPAGNNESPIPLERCMRVYAHQQDTGGFFIAILQKKSEIKAKQIQDPKKTGPTPVTSIVEEIRSQPEDKIAPKVDAADEIVQPAVTTASEDDDTSNKRKVDDVDEVGVSSKKPKTKEDIEEVSEASTAAHAAPPGAMLDAVTRPGDMRQSQRNRNAQQFEEPFKYISASHPDINTVRTFYNISPRFPLDRFLVRNAMAEPAKTIYYTTSLIREILTENEGKGIKFIHGGVKMFMRQDVQSPAVCKWRIQSEGMPILQGYVGEERIVRCHKKETLRKLLREMFPKVSDGAWRDLGEIGERVRDVAMGCCVLRCEESDNADEDDGFEEHMVIPLWRSMHSINLMMAKEERSALLLRLFNDTTPLVNNSKDFQKKDRAPVDADAADALEDIEIDYQIEVPIEGHDGDRPMPDPAADEAASRDVAPGFIVENGEVHVAVTNTSLEATNQEVGKQEAKLDGAEIHPGPYSDVVVDGTHRVQQDVKMEQVKKGEDTGVGGGYEA